MTLLNESWKAPVEVVQEYRSKLEYKLVGSERIKRGHSIFEFEFDTGILKIITPKPENISKVTRPQKLRNFAIPGQPVEETTRSIKIQKRPGCLYFSRLNYKSAFRYLSQIMPGITFTKIP